MVQVNELTAALKKQAQKNSNTQALAAYNSEEVARLTMQILGLLAQASSQDIRRRVLDKARRMLTVR